MIAAAVTSLSAGAAAIQALPVADAGTAGSLSWLQALLLGVVQGLTEFLPISSSGHLAILPPLLGWQTPQQLTAVIAVIQLGTTAALVLFFWRDITRISRAWVASVASIPSAGIRGSISSIEDDALRHDAMMGWLVIGATIPIGILGLAFQDSIESASHNLRLVGSLLIIFGVALWWVDAVMPARKSAREFTAVSAAIMGLAQALALMPGVSRSGATITAGRAMGFSREAAARFSFLLSIPAIVLSGVYEAGKNIGTPGMPWGEIAVAILVAGAVGYASIAWLLKFLVTHSMKGFAIYRFGLGGVVLVLSLTGAIG